MNFSLTSDQQRVAEEFQRFLFTSDREFIIQGAGGVGKTALVPYLVNVIYEQTQNAAKLLGTNIPYEYFYLTALTNKAVEVLKQTVNDARLSPCTIHQLLGLKVSDDYQTGGTKISQPIPKIIHDAIIFIDEASMIDDILLKWIRDCTHRCKIVYIGDKQQLGPVKGTISPIYKQGLPIHELTQPVRNAGQPALMELCQSYREFSANGTIPTVREVPGVIDFIPYEHAEAEIKRLIQTRTDFCCVAYTNPRVDEYHHFLRYWEGRTAPYEVGELLVLEDFFQDGLVSIATNAYVTILDVKQTTFNFTVRGPDGNEFIIETYPATLGVSNGSHVNCYLPKDQKYLTDLMKYFAKAKYWKGYFFLKKKFPRTRHRQTNTIHKSQGSTFNTVVIDLPDLSTCRQPLMLRQLAYVAVTRASNRVVFLGDMPRKLGIRV